MGKVQYATDSDFEAKVLGASQPVLVDFWGADCPPCKALAPVFEELADEFGDRVRFVKVDVEASRKVPATYSILSIPTIILFKEGKPVQQMVGFRGKAAIKKLLEVA